MGDLRHLHVDCLHALIAASHCPGHRPDPAPNKNFISEWGESLRQGAGEAWAPYLATTSQLANLQVAKPVS